MPIPGPRGVRTHAGDADFSDALSGGTSDLEIDHFRIGEGGWELVAQPIGPPLQGPKAPVASRINLEATHDLTTPNPSNDPCYFQKSLGPGEFFYDNGTLQVTCILGAFEASDNGNGLQPKFFEIGLFNVGGVLLYYATFPGAYKVDGISWSIKLNIKLR